MFAAVTARQEAVPDLPVRNVFFEECRLKAAAPDKVDDFERIACGERGFWPFGTGYDVSVALDRDAVTLEDEDGDEVGYGGRVGQLGELTRLPVDDDLHIFEGSSKTARSRGARPGRK